MIRKRKIDKKKNICIECYATKAISYELRVRACKCVLYRYVCLCASVHLRNAQKHLISSVIFNVLIKIKTIFHTPCAIHYRFIHHYLQILLALLTEIISNVVLEITFALFLVNNRLS